MHFSDYQKAAPNTAKMDLSTDDGKIELALGLSAETGSVSKIFKKLVRDGISLGTQKEQLKDELGDVLWYVAVIAHSMELPLEEVAKSNIDRTADRYGLTTTQRSTFRPTYDEDFPPEERFPRRILFRLKAVEKDDLPHVEFTVEEAGPNPFPKGAQNVAGKTRGFSLNEPIGDVVNDNADGEDGYRFHDAVHIAFMAVLGWSPVMRALLRIKRKSDQAVDRVQDGARATDLEEALSALLKEASESRNSFGEVGDIDGEVRDLIPRVIGRLEVASAPIWLWVEAIHQGYQAMAALTANNGGWLKADLDQQKVTFYNERPE